MAVREEAMTAEQFSKAVTKLDHNTNTICVPLGISRRQAHRYASEEQPVPMTVALLLKMYLKHGIPGEKR